jgi:hypothetical protein
MQNNELNNNIIIKINKATAKPNYMRERNGAAKSNVLSSGSPVANPKSRPDYSVFIRK